MLHQLNVCLRQVFGLKAIHIVPAANGQFDVAKVEVAKPFHFANKMAGVTFEAGELGNAIASHVSKI